MDNFMESFQKFMEKHKHIIWILAIVMSLLLLATFVYSNNVVPASKEPFPAINHKSQETSLEELPEGLVKQTFISSEESLDGISLQFGTYQKDNQGTIQVTVKDTLTETVYLDQKFAMNELKDNELRPFMFTEAADGVQGHAIEIALDIQHDSEQNQITLWASSFPNEGSQLEISGQTVDKEMSFQAFSGTNHFLKPVFFVALFVILMAAVLLYILVFIKKAKIQNVFLVLAFLVGIFYTSLLTPNSVPDEGNHIDTAYRYSNAMMFKDKETENGNMLKRIEDVEKMQVFGIDPSMETYASVLDNFFEPAQDTQLVEVKGGNITTVAWLYIPSAVGITISRLLNFGTIPLLYLGRLCNFAVFVLCGYFAIKKTPVGKMVLFAVALLPMTMQLAFSYSYDAIIIGLAFLFISNCLYLAYSKEKIRIRDVLLLCIVGILLAPCKGGAYLPVCFLCLIVPCKRFDTKKQYWIAIVAVLAVSLISFGGFSLASSLQATSGARGSLAWIDSPGYTIDFIFSHPAGFLKILMNTIVVYGDFYVTSLFGQNLGWFNIPISLTIIMAFLFIVAASSIKRQDDPQPIKLGHKLWLIVICLGVFFLTELGMFTGWTPVGNQVIEGVQGRYFLVILPLLVLLLRNSTLTLKRNIDNQLIYGLFIAQTFAITNIFQSVL